MEIVKALLNSERDRVLKLIEYLNESGVAKSVMQVDAEIRFYKLRLTYLDKLLAVKMDE